jgi:hypothetical protein
LSEVAEVAEDDVVSFTFVNTADSNAWISFWEAPAGMSTQMYADAFEESGGSNETFWNLGGGNVTWWEIPANETYEIRTTFKGTPMGTGLVGCGLGGSEIVLFAGSFNVLDP